MPQPSHVRPEPARAIPVPGVQGYVERLGARRGEPVRFHVNAPAAYELAVVRLGRDAILDAPTDDAADRADVETLHVSRHAQATPQTLAPGSYLYVEGEPVPEGPLTMGLWLRLWRLPVIDVVQWAWFGLVTDLDFPDRSRFGLIVDHAGRLAVYSGDGGAFDHAWLHVSEPVLADRLGAWVHVLASIGPAGVRVVVDGHEVLAVPDARPLAAPGPASRLRVGASAELGLAADMLDGDIAQPFVAASVLDDAAIARVVADRGRTPATGLGLGPLHAAWDLAEERGTDCVDASGNGRAARLVNGGTWQVGGPAYDASKGLPGSDALADPDRGHGLRLSSDDLTDAEWSVTDEWRVPDDAVSGLYAGVVRLVGRPDADVTAIVFAVVDDRPTDEDTVALLLSTNTWVAYGRRPTVERRTIGLEASFYSNHISGRPFYHVSTQAPIPRADPWGFESDRAAHTRHSHLVRPERYAEAWLAREGYRYTVITDQDLHEDPGLLSRFRALFIAGHSEYWSDEARAGVERYLAAGGQVLCLSGNTMWWRTSFSDDGTNLECRKQTGGTDVRWIGPSKWGERWHSYDGREGGGYAFFGRPGWEVLGLDTQGMIDDATATAFAAINVLRPDESLFHHPERVPTTAAGTIGEHSFNGPRASGYEFDATPHRLGVVDEPVPGMTVLASALGQRNIEWNYVERDHGADVIWWERSAGGVVFNIGSIAATGALAADPGVATLVRNVLSRFEVARDDGERRVDETGASGRPPAAG